MVSKTLQQLAGQKTMQQMKSEHFQLEVNEVMSRLGNSTFLPYKKHVVNGSKKKERNIF